MLAAEHEFYNIINEGPEAIREDMFGPSGLWKPCFVFYFSSCLCILSFIKLQFTDNTIYKTLTPLSRKTFMCRICKIYTRNDIEHCDDCGTCCELFDHHCDILSVCISARTFKFFFLFFFYFGLNWLIIVGSHFILSMRLDNRLRIRIDEELLFVQVFSVLFGIIFIGVAIGFSTCTCPCPSNCIGETSQETIECIE